VDTWALLFIDINSLSQPCAAAPGKESVTESGPQRLTTGHFEAAEQPPSAPTAGDSVGASVDRAQCGFQELPGDLGAIKAWWKLGTVAAPEVDM
jgi:hypothetical protein